MTQSANKALVARYYEQVLTRGDVAALDALLAPEFRSWLPDGSSVGAGPYRDAVLASRQAFPDLAVTVLDQVAEGDRVATRWLARGTHRGVFAGVPPPAGRSRSPPSTSTASRAQARRALGGDQSPDPAAAARGCRLVTATTNGPPGLGCRPRPRWRAGP